MIFHYSANEKIYYNITGTGKAQILFVHGFGASHKTWDYIIDFFDTEKYALIFVDLLGHGNSSIDKNSDYSLVSQTSVIYRFIKFLKLNDFIIIGHSYGGNVSLMLGVLFAKNIKIKKMILIDAGAYNHIPLSIRYLQNPFLKSISLFANQVTPKNLTGYFILRNLYYDRTLITKERINKYIQFFSQSRLKAIINAAQNILPDNFDNLILKYKEIDTPALIIWGKNDFAIPFHFGQKLNSDLKNSNLAIIENCGHIPHEEKPDDTFHIINKFL